MKTRSLLMGIPIGIWIIVLVIGPVLIMFFMSFRVKLGPQKVSPLSLGNYLEFFANPIYWKLLLKSFRISLMVSLVAIVASYPLAYFISRKLKRFRNILFMLIITPLWVSYLVRIIAWRTILGNKGLLNLILMEIGIINEPIKFLIYSQFAVVVTLAYIAIPFVFIPLYTALEKIPKNLIDASMDLGANNFKTLFRIILPLSSPGLVTGFMLSFIIALGDYIIPQQIGGSGGMMYGNIVWSQFGIISNWYLGAALGFILFAMAAVIIGLVRKFGSREGVYL
ncbi:MAG TPA: ABC transporter permease [Spirochaetes bacterium]|nr:ABC transporter permease [Spirochaetota bacterium]